MQGLWAVEKEGGAAHHGHRIVYVIILAWVSTHTCTGTMHTVFQPLGYRISIIHARARDTYMRYRNALSAVGPAQYSLGLHMHAQAPPRLLHGPPGRRPTGGDTNCGSHCWSS